MRGWMLVFIAGLTVSSAAQQVRDKSLSIYVVDVEGGNATLFVGPTGGSVLIDTGNGGAAAARDADRIMAAVKDAGLAQIDHLITTHWHGDHFGGMAEVAKRIPIRHFVDHGPNVQPAAAADEFLQKVYPTLYGAAKHTVAKPGDTLAVQGLDWRIVTSAGNVLASALPGAGRPNPYCADYTAQDVDRTENAQSVGSVVTFGRFRVAHLGDLTWNKEFDLMCPSNRLGTVDLFVVSHHGQPVSNSPQLVHALESRAAIINNGTRKGGQPDAMRVIYSAPRLEDVWQIHFSLLSGQEFTVPGLFIANWTDDHPDAMPLSAMPPPAPGGGAPPPPVHNGPAHWIKVSATADGSFTVTNGRNGFSKRYGIERAARIEDATLAEVNEVTPEISTAELRDVLARRSATVFDARPYDEFAISHIPGAVNVAPKAGVPMSMYVSDVAEIGRAVSGKDAPIVIYCNGANCGKSKRLAAELVEAGYSDVRRYQLGMPMWRALGGICEIEADAVRRMLVADRTAVVIDTREPREFQRGSLTGARNIPRRLVLEGKDVGEVKRAKDDGRLPMDDHNTRIVVVGAGAAEAGYVAEALAREAFHNVTYFAGPIDRLLAARSQ
jgi:beta-lactamase superfamily II metal-dependent hydrolase/rhodanese-related sulfurtransferase